MLPAASASMPMTQNQPLPDPGLTNDPPRQSNPNTVDDDSDSEGVILTMEPERRRGQAPSLTVPEPTNQTLSTQSHSPGAPPSALSYEQGNSPSNSVNVVATGEPSIVQRRSKRSTAGHHTNPFHLPRSVNQTLATSARTSQVPHAVNNQAVQEVFKPWL